MLGWIVGPFHAEHARRLVQRIPPIDGKSDDGQVDCADKAEDRCRPHGAHRIPEGVPESDVPDIDEE